MTTTELEKRHLLSFFTDIFNDNCIIDENGYKDYTFNFKGYIVNVQYKSGDYTIIVQEIDNEHNYKVFESLSLDLRWMDYIHSENRANRRKIKH